MSDTHTKLLQKIKNYKMPGSAIELLSQNPPLIISAVTASGKNTVADFIIASTDHRETVSHTTRLPRPGEVDGEHYHFVDDTKMLALVKQDAFIEIKAIHGNTVYGTSLKSYEQVVKSGYKPLLVIDVQGVEEISQAIPKLRPYFLLPPSYEEWMDRLHSRGVITKADKANRITSAKRELTTVLQNPAYILIVNDQVKMAANKILSGQVDEAQQKHNKELAKKLLDQLNS